MRRAALQPLRAAAVRRTQHHRHAVHPRSALTRLHYSTPPRLQSIRNTRAATDRHRRPVPPDAVLRLAPPLQASLFFRNAAMALLSSLVAYGGWFVATTYRAGSPSAGDLAANASSPKYGPLVTVPMRTPLALAPTGADPTASSTPAPASDGAAATDDPAAAADPTRRAVVLDHGSLLLSELPLDADTATLSKDAAGGGRVVLEMVTPEQATRRLRANESSFRVDRGAGAVRYDVVQLASNHPIEDDHVERVVQVPEALVPEALAPEGEGNGVGRRDWMFWGVFDGHRFVLPGPRRGSHRSEACC